MLNNSIGCPVTYISARVAGIKRDTASLTRGERRKSTGFYSVKVLYSLPLHPERGGGGLVENSPPPLSEKAHMITSAYDKESTKKKSGHGLELKITVILNL